ncbi:MAG: MJ1477/TM1410 family putative glycoside hydrolase [Hyphomicrobium sp.]
MSTTRFALSFAAALLAPLFSAHAEDRAALLGGVKTWAYQLKDVSQDKIDKINASAFDMVIIDSSMFPNGKEIRLTRDQVESMKKKPDGGRRLVISYFSAGEAEDFRYYWKPEWNKKRPGWVYKADKDWKGDYIVKYWEPDWQRIIYGTPDSLIDRIMDAGFDGVSIDRVDAYYYFGDTNERRAQMIDLVKRISNYMRAKNPQSVVLAQNAEELLDKPDYIEAIDATVKEDLVFGISHKEVGNPAGDITHSTKLLDDSKVKGKRVFVVEYLVKKDNIAKAREYMKQHDFVLYVGQRDLYELSGVVGDEGIQKGAKPAEKPGEGGSQAKSE